jgi:hypothetical protein
VNHPAGFLPSIQRIKCGTKRDERKRNRHGVRGAANNMTTDFVFRSRLFHIPIWKFPEWPDKFETIKADSLAA